MIIPDAGGALSCDISWTCPTLTFGGDPLTELLEMRVYRDGVLIYTDPSPVSGDPGTYTDIPTVQGLYSYSVKGFNAVGEGASVNVEALWVGEDAPAAVTPHVKSVAIRACITGLNCCMNSIILYS